MLAIRETIAFDPTAVPSVASTAAHSSIASPGRHHCRHGAVGLAARAATRDPSTSPISMLRLRLRITPAMATAASHHPTARPRAGPQSDAGQGEGGDDVDGGQSRRPDAQEAGRVLRER